MALIETPEQRALRARQEAAAAAKSQYKSYVNNPDPSFQDMVYGRARETGWANANRWLVMVFPNERVRNSIGMNFVPDVARLATTCKSVVLNEQTWFTTEQNYLNAAANRIFPYKRNTNNSSGLKLQFNVGTDMFEKEFFQTWLGYIQNPSTHQFRFYDDYAYESEIYIILLPNHVQNFQMAMEAVDTGYLTGFRLTECYPFTYNINGGSLNYTNTSEPLFVDVGFMYHEMLPLRPTRKQFNNTIPTITDTGFPEIGGRRKKKDGGMKKAINGFVTDEEEPENWAYSDIPRKQRGMLESYSKQLNEIRYDDLPKGIDGRVVYSTPRQGGLDLGLTVLSQTQGFFGAGFFGNGFYP
jgi:hypothetical protein